MYFGQFLQYARLPVGEGLDDDDDDDDGGGDDGSGGDADNTDGTRLWSVSIDTPVTVRLKNVGEGEREREGQI